MRRLIQLGAIEIFVWLVLLFTTLIISKGIFSISFGTRSIFESIATQVTKVLGTGILVLVWLISWKKVDGVISLSGDAGPLARIIPDVKKKADPILPPEKLKDISQQVSAATTRIYERVCELIRKYQKPILAVGPNVDRGTASGLSDFTPAQFRSPERAAQAAAALYQYYHYRKAVGMEA